MSAEEGKSQETPATPEELDKKEHLLKKIPKKTSKNTLALALAAFLVVLSGIGTGWILSGGRAKSDLAKKSVEQEGVVESETEAGFTDTSDLEGPVEGKLEEGGIEGEGTHHLVREGGPSKYVYLTSTVIDLEGFVGKQVDVWGETIAGRHAGWLMDVERIEVVK